MADYSSITLEYNTGTDAAPTWTGTALTPAGSGGANELRMAMSGTGATTTTASASWPFMNKPTSGTSVVSQIWAFSTNTSGSQVATYDGTNGKANVFRFSFSADGNPVSAMQLTAYGDSTHTAPTAGTQPPGSHQDPWTNGQTTDTSSTSYLKANAYDQGLTSAGTQETPAAGSVGTSPSATTGTAGAVTVASAAWMTNYQSLQGLIQYIQGSNAPQTATAFFWYWVAIWMIGANIATGTFTHVVTLLYTYS